MEKVGHQVMGIGPRQRSITTGRIFKSPYYDSIKQTDLHYDAHLRPEDVYMAPGVQFDEARTQICQAEILLTIKRSFPTLIDDFISDTYQGVLLPEYPILDLLEPRKTESHVLGAIFANEGTTDGTYEVHENIFLQQLGFKEDSAFFKDFVSIVIGDQKTAALSRRVQQDQEFASNAYDRKRWLLPVTALFHWRQNRLWAMQSVYSGTVSGSSQASLASHMNYWKVLQVPLEKAPFAVLEQLVLSSWDARIMAFLSYELERQGITINSAKDLEDALQRLGKEGLRRTIEGLAETIFSESAYVGRDNPVENDEEHLAHIRFLNDGLLYKSMCHGIRHGDIGLIERALSASIFWCAGTKSHNYTAEMLNLRWLFTSGGGDKVRRAILSCSLINLQGKPDTWMEMDYHMELLNGTFKVVLADRRSSSFDLDVLMHRTAMVLDYYATLKPAIERTFDIHISNSHTRRTDKEQVFFLSQELSKSSIVQSSRHRSLGLEVPNTLTAGSASLWGAIEAFNTNRFRPRGTSDDEASDGEDGDGVSYDIGAGDMPDDAAVADITVWCLVWPLRSIANVNIQRAVEEAELAADGDDVDEGSF